MIFLRGLSVIRGSIMPTQEGTRWTAFLGHEMTTAFEIDTEQLRGDAIAHIQRHERKPVAQVALRILSESTLRCEKKQVPGANVVQLTIEGSCASLEDFGAPQDQLGLLNHILQGAFQAVKPAPIDMFTLTYEPEPGAPGPDWPQVDNQGTGAPHRWNNLNFRSISEIKIAEALDLKDVLFFPLCRGRLSELPRLGADPDERPIRRTREPDFLVCYRGKWGILEVDGEEFHPPGRAAWDHAKDRLIERYGIYVSHFDAHRCWEDPMGVVNEFLTILDQSSR